MTRHFYYVDYLGGKWDVSTRDPTPWCSPVHYGTRRAAVDVAMRMASREWQVQHRPTGVRVQTEAGNYVEQKTFGRDGAD